jgi:regulator of sirC expression with transglutaminase-like and TPR domain
VEFREYAEQPDADLALWTGALLVARDEHPALDFDRETQRIDALAAGLDARRLRRSSLDGRIDTLAAYLFEECGFACNVADYYDPNNSFVDVVLDRRLGIPVTLAVVYVEVAIRAGVDARGVAFPGHFLVRVESEHEVRHVDPVDGSVVDTAELERRVRAVLGERAFLQPDMLEPTPVRHTIARMLMNLRGIYAERGDFARLLVVLDRLIDLLPVLGSEVRDRGLLKAKLGAPRAAIDDLARYVESLSNAEDVDEIRRLM